MPANLTPYAVLVTVTAELLTNLALQEITEIDEN